MRQADPLLLAALRCAESGDLDTALQALADVINQRAGKTISADTASKIQGAIQHILAAKDSHENAIKALQVLVDLGTAGPDKISDLGAKQVPVRGSHGGDVNQFRSRPNVPEAVADRMAGKRATAQQQLLDQFQAVLQENPAVDAAAKKEALKTLQLIINQAGAAGDPKAFWQIGKTFVPTHYPSVSAGADSLDPVTQSTVDQFKAGPLNLSK